MDTNGARRQFRLSTERNMGQVFIGEDLRKDRGVMDVGFPDMLSRV
jgi:hypothetical protein